MLGIWLGDMLSESGHSAFLSYGFERKFLFGFFSFVCFSSEKFLILMAGQC